MALLDRRQAITCDDMATGLACWWSDMLFTEPWTTMRERVPAEARERYDLEAWITLLFFVTYASQMYFRDEPRLPGILNMFHRLVYTHMHRNGGLSLEQVQALDQHVRMRYTQYYDALKTEGDAGPLWHLAAAMTANMFGEGFRDAETIMTISMQFMNQTAVAGKAFFSRFRLVD